MLEYVQSNQRWVFKFRHRVVQLDVRIEDDQSGAPARPGSSNTGPAQRACASVACRVHKGIGRRRPHRLPAVKPIHRRTAMVPNLRVPRLHLGPAHFLSTDRVTLLLLFSYYRPNFPLPPVALVLLLPGAPHPALSRLVRRDASTRGDSRRRRSHRSVSSPSLSLLNLPY